MGKIYFEYPRIREDGTFISKGQATMVMARAADIAQQAIESAYGNVPVPRVLH